MALSEEAPLSLEAAKNAKGQTRLASLACISPRFFASVIMLFRDQDPVCVRAILRLTSGCVLSVLAALFTGCLAREAPLPPDEALARAHERVERILEEEQRFRGGAVVQEQAEAPEDPSTVNLWFFTHPLLSPVLGRPDRIEAFNQAHPGVTLKPLFIGDWHIAIQKLTVSLAAGDLPDIALVKRAWLARLAESGRVMPLDGFLPGKLIADLHPKARELYSTHGQLFGLPADGFCKVLFFNSTLVGEVPPRTWAELRVAASQLAPALTEPGQSAIGDFPYIEALWSAGGRVYHGVRSGLGDLEAREALDFLLGLRRDGFTGPAFGNSDYAFGEFTNGRAAMTVASSQDLAQSARASFPIAMAPVPGKDGPIGSLSDDVIIIFARHAHAKREGIIEVLDFLTGPQVQGAEAAHMGSMPIRKSVVEGVELPPGLKEAYDSARFPPLAGSWTAVEMEIYRHLHLAYRWKPEDAKK
jgi:multiple sugar transport system substrate-binding protein